MLRCSDRFRTYSMTLGSRVSKASEWGVREGRWLSKSEISPMSDSCLVTPTMVASSNEPGTEMVSDAVLGRRDLLVDRCRCRLGGCGGYVCSTGGTNSSVSFGGTGGGGLIQPSPDMLPVLLV